MEDEEDDVFEPDPHCWRTTFREIKCEDRGTQTPGPALAPNNGMLPCGVAEEPRPLFYGNAGFRLHFPAHFELVGDQEVRRQESEGEQNGMEQLPQQRPVARSVEACIGQKLQLIGDQFHREHLQLCAVCGGKWHEGCLASNNTLHCVSSKPKEPGADVVAPGRGSAQPSV